MGERHRDAPIPAALGHQALLVWIDHRDALGLDQRARDGQALDPHAGARGRRGRKISHPHLGHLLPIFGDLGAVLRVELAVAGVEAQEIAHLGPGRAQHALDVAEDVGGLDADITGADERAVCTRRDLAADED